MNSPCVFKYRDVDQFLAFIEITNKCNMKCRHCMNDSKEYNKTEFSKEEIIRLIDELAENNTEKIYISGGEPLLYPYIDDAILYANSKGIKITLATNGTEIPKHIDIIKKGVQTVSISMDGIGEIHDKFRRVPGAFEKCTTALKLLKENGVKTKISAMIWKDNINELEDMVILAKKYGVSKFNFAFLIPEGRAKLDESIQISKEKYKDIVNKVKNIIEKYSTNTFDIRLRRTQELDNESADCFGGKNLIHITAKGKVSPCSWISKVDVNNDFSSQWPENTISDCIKKFEKFEECKKNRKEKFGYCGCIALAYLYNGGFEEKDPLNEFLDKEGE